MRALPTFIAPHTQASWLVRSRKKSMNLAAASYMLRANRDIQGRDKWDRTLFQSSHSRLRSPLSTSSCARPFQNGIAQTVHP